MVTRTIALSCPRAPSRRRRPAYGTAPREVQSAYEPAAAAPPRLAAVRQVIEPAVDAGHLFHPLLSLRVIQVKDLVQRPVEVIGQIGYLLSQAFKGVAYNPPSSARSTSYLA